MNYTLPSFSFPLKLDLTEKYLPYSILEDAFTKMIKKRINHEIRWYTTPKVLQRWQLVTLMHLNLGHYLYHHEIVCVRFMRLISERWMSKFLALYIYYVYEKKHIYHPQALIWRIDFSLDHLAPESVAMKGKTTSHKRNQWTPKAIFSEQYIVFILRKKTLYIEFWTQNLSLKRSSMISVPPMRMLSKLRGEILIRWKAMGARENVEKILGLLLC